VNIARLLKQFPGVRSEDGASLVLPRELALQVAECLKNDPEFKLDYCSNVTGVDYPDRIEKSKAADGSETSKKIPGFLETVYHLYSIENKQGPLAIRVRTADRTNTRVPSLTPIWRAAELQEREAYDLFGIHYIGHPDLRRILMWDDFEDHPMRKDYQEPDDYHYEPTPHDEVLEKARKHYGAA